MTFKLISFLRTSVLSILVILCTDATGAEIGPPEIEPSTIQMIAAIFRHGDRSPRELYPNDPYKNKQWPGGLGALSKKGALQHFNLGSKLREKYHQLLPNDGQYTQNDIHVRSSEYERCIMSAQSLLAGFMPPERSENLLPIDWQPIPVTSVSGAFDKLISQQQPCKKYDNLMQSLLENPPDDLRKMNADNKALYRYLTKHTGQNITTCFDLGMLYNTLEIENNAGLTLPDWTANVYPGNMREFQERTYELFTETPFMKKVKGGALITEIYNNMANKGKKTLNPDRKIFLYSGHDITVFSVIRALNITSQTTRLPDYASALVFELHKMSDSDNSLEVKLFFHKNSEDSFPKQINIPGCDNPCTFIKFGESVKHLLIDDYDKLCENPNSTELPAPVYVI